MNQDICLLCEEELSKKGVKEGEKAFCCFGCLTVYNVITGKGETPGKDHPFFLRAKEKGFIEEKNKQAKEIAKETATDRFDIEGMWCPSCADLIERLCLSQKGVYYAYCDYATDSLTVKTDQKKISRAEIKALLAPFGYKLFEFGEKEGGGFPYRLELLVAIIIALQTMMLSYPLYAFDGVSLGWEKIFSYLLILLAFPLVGFSALPLFRKAFFGLLTGTSGMELLVSLGVISAFSTSLFSFLQGERELYIDSLAFIVAFVLLGKFIESKAKFSSKKALHSLKKSLPKKVRTLQGFEKIENISIGTHFIVEKGERIPLDGKVIEGEGTCNEAILTGEPFSLPKKPHHSVIGGSILEEGRLVVASLATFENSTLMKIVDGIQQGFQEKRKKKRSLTDRISIFFIPVILTLATSSFLYHFFYSGEKEAIQAFLSVLLISCPCALGIAVPIVEAKMQELATKKGMLIRNRDVFEIFGKESLFIFDKTGTLTEGKPEIFEGLEKLEKGSLSSLASLAKHSRHPLSRAIARHIQKDPMIVEEVFEFPGKGIQGRVGGAFWKLGSEEFVKSTSYSKGEKLSFTSVFFANHQGVEGVLKLKDKLRDSAKKVIKELSPVKTIILSGDQEEVVKELALELNCSGYFGKKTPFDKKSFIEEAKNNGETVVMLGDGINDAPALAIAHVGISMAAAEEMSMHVSDIVMLTDRLEAITELRSLFKKGRRIMKQNLFWAFFYNGLALPLAAMGTLIPVFAAGAMVGSSLLILLNTERLK